MAAKFSYPDILPAPLLSAYSLKQSTGLSVTEFSTGRARARKLPARPSTMKATWRMNEANAELFESALENWLLGRWFLITVKLPRSIKFQEVEALFITDPRENRKPTASSLTYWDYSADLQIKPLPQLDEGILLAAQLSPYIFEDLITRIQTKITELS